MGLIATIASAEPLVLNEYNAVSGSNFLNGGDEFVDEDGNTSPPFDPFFGRVQGNGGDWFELVVVAEGLDIRGWQLEIFSDGVVEPRLVFTDASLWQSLEAGTIITVAEDVPDDPSYDPANGDWWINVNAANPEDGGTGEFITADNFPVNNDDWQLTIYDAEGNVVFGPAGEGIVSDDGIASDIGVNSREVFALQASPAADIGRDDPGYNDSNTSSFGAPNGVLDQVAQDFTPLRTDQPWPDRDFDGISEDGNRNGIVGDATCIGGATANCDDNCALVANPGQADTGGIGNALADGIGNACQCGDVNNDGQVLQNDGLRVRAFALGILPQLPSPTKCDVSGDGLCDLFDAAVILRAQTGQPPGVTQSCEAAVGPEDETDLLYAADRVVEIDVTMDPTDFQTLREQTRDINELIEDPECGTRPWPSPFTWFPADITVDGAQQINLVGIRKKGFQGSLSEEKPALKLDLGRFIAGSDINGVTRLTLNNARQDPSLVKQCLAFQIYRDAGLAASRCNFAQVSVNGEELGIYVNVEEVDETFVARNFNDPLGKLFEAEISDFWPGPWINTWDPDTETAEDGNEEILDLANVLEFTPYETLLPELEARVDIPWFVRYWAIEALIAHSDGYAFNMNNSFFYVSPMDNQMRFGPWDMDSDFFPEGQSIFAIRSALARRMYNLPDTQALFLAEVQALVDTLWDADAYLAEIDRVDALLSPRLLALFGQGAVNEMRFFQDTLRSWLSNREGDVLAELAAPPVDVRDVQVPHLCEQDVP